MFKKIFQNPITQVFLLSAAFVAALSTYLVMVPPEQTVEERRATIVAEIEDARMERDDMNELLIDCGKLCVGAAIETREGSYFGDFQAAIVGVNVRHDAKSRRVESVRIIGSQFGAQAFDMQLVSFANQFKLAKEW